MLSKAQREYFYHPSTHPVKNVRYRRTQDDRLLCAASKHIRVQTNYPRDINY
jgi:hypothetical protein